jgi:uroporphyrinogen-III synthase
VKYFSIELCNALAMKKVYYCVGEKTREEKQTIYFVNHKSV